MLAITPNATATFCIRSATSKRREPEGSRLYVVVRPRRGVTAVAAAGGIVAILLPGRGNDAAPDDDRRLVLFELEPLPAFRPPRVVSAAALDHRKDARHRRVSRSNFFHDDRSERKRRGAVLREAVDVLGP